MSLLPKDKVMRMSDFQSAGLALGGGGARGWAHIGVLLALAEKDIHITHIAGTSIGAFVGAFYATGSFDVLRENVVHFNWKQGLGYFASVPSKEGILNGHTITKFLEEHLGEAFLEDTPIPLCTVATDLRTGKEVTMRKGSITEAVRASIAVPGIFTPVQKENSLLVDGGLVNPVPVSTVRGMGAEQVIAVDLNMLSTGPDTPMLIEEGQPNLLEIVGASANIIEAGLTENRFAADPPDLLIRPDLTHISYLDFSKGKESIRLGYEAAIQALE
jgi:NTE family protein